jgi:carbon storage regulator CsrA
MLVLTRKYQERIRIGNNITITVLRMKGKSVRIGIEAPSNVTVIRGELAFYDDKDPAIPMDSKEPIQVIADRCRRRVAARLSLLQS